MSTYVLRFISGKYQGTEYVLPEEGEVIFGRSSEADVVLAEDMVSRRHARMNIQGPGDLELEDLGSTNGIFVNGDKVEKGHIEEGDRLLIGTSIIKVVVMEGELAPPPAPPDLPARDRARTTAHEVSMSGSLSEVGLNDLLQLFMTSRKTGTLVIQNEVEQGRIHLREGRIASATLESDPVIAPDKAFFRIMSWTRGSFELLHDPEDFGDEEISMSGEMLILEAARRQDELARLGDQIPSPETKISLVMPLPTRLRDLSGEQLDVFQVVLEQDTVRGVLDHSEMESAQTAEALAELISLGLVACEEYGNTR